MILQKEIDFILAVDALKNVNRRNYNVDDSRRENTAEHSWQIIILAQILFPYAKNKENIDLLRVIRMLSIHDLVEIHAGDTFIFDENLMQGKFEREKIAARKIFGVLGNGLSDEFYHLWLEFEEEKSPDAIFACGIDRIMPYLLNTFTSAKSWTEAGVTARQTSKIIEYAVKKASTEMGQLFDFLQIQNLKDGKLLP